MSLAKGSRALSGAWSGYDQEEASGLYEIAARLKARNDTLPIFKVQLMGPLSLAAYSEEIVGSLSQKLPEAGKAVLMQISWLIEFCRDISPHLIVQLDEPGLGGWNRLSSVEAKEAKDLFSYLYVTQKELGVWVALHSCAQIGEEFFSIPADLYSFDPSCLSPDLSSQSILTGKAPKGAALVPGFYPSGGPVAEDRFKQSASLESAFWGSEEPLSLHSASCGHALADESLLRALYSGV